LCVVGKVKGVIVFVLKYVCSYVKMFAGHCQTAWRGAGGMPLHSINISPCLPALSYCPLTLFFARARLPACFACLPCCTAPALFLRLPACPVLLPPSHPAGSRQLEQLRAAGLPSSRQYTGLDAHRCGVFQSAGYGVFQVYFHGMWLVPSSRQYTGLDAHRWNRNRTLRTGFGFALGVCFRLLGPKITTTSGAALAPRWTIQQGVYAACYVIASCPP
jgi:hypothetical protein